MSCADVHEYPIVNCPTGGPAPLPLPELWRPLVMGYLDWLAAIGRPRSTQNTRRSHLGRMTRALPANPFDTTPTDVSDWFSKQIHWGIETRRGYRNTVVGFFRWCWTEGRLPDDLGAQLPTVKAAAPAPRPAPDRVWAATCLASDHPRVTLMLRLAVEAGLRRAEVAQVSTDDLIDGFDGAQLIVHGKGNRQRLIPITDELADAIRAGAPGHTPGSVDTGWLFPGNEDGHLSARYVGKLCAQAMPGVWTMHSLRHRFATNAYRGTRNLRAVQMLLGHSSVAVTERYTAVDDREIRAAMEAAACSSAPPDM